MKDRTIEWILACLVLLLATVVIELAWIVWLS